MPLPAIPAAALGVAFVASAVTPWVIKGIERWGDTRNKETEEKGKTGRHTESVKAAEHVAIVAVPTLMAGALGLVALGDRYVERQIAELDRIERAAREAGDEAAATDARSRNAELASRDGMGQRMLDGILLIVNTAVGLIGKTAVESAGSIRHAPVTILGESANSVQEEMSTHSAAESPSD